MVKLLAKPRNPDWTRDETILLLDLYLRRPRHSATDPAVRRLSEILNLAPAAPQLRLATYRNPTGIAMKLVNLAQQDPVFLATGRKGLRGGGENDAEVWRTFAHDRPALAEQVERILSAWGLLDFPTTGQLLAPSRGPLPSFGTVKQERVDGETQVYVLRLQGPVGSIMPNHTMRRGWAVMKIGRSNEVDRRCAELNAGLPPPAILHWQPLMTKEFGGAMAAHVEERRLLAIAASNGWSLGGEFVLAPVAALRGALCT